MCVKEHKTLRESEGERTIYETMEASPRTLGVGRREGAISEESGGG